MHLCVQNTQNSVHNSEYNCQSRAIFQSRSVQENQCNSVSDKLVSKKCKISNWDNSGIKT